MEDSGKLINNVMNLPPEQRGHSTTQADLAQAQRVVEDRVRELQNQTQPLNEAQKKELADARAALNRLAPPAAGAGSPSSSTSSSSGSQAPGSSATATGGASPPGTTSGEPATTVDGNGRSISGTTSTSSTTGGQPAGTSATTNDVTPPGSARNDGPAVSDIADPNAGRMEEDATGDRADPSAVLLPGSDRNGNGTGQPTGRRDNGEAAEPVLAGGGGNAPTLTAAANPPPGKIRQAPGAIGTVVNGPGTTNPNGPMASAGGLPPPPPAGPTVVPQPTTTAPVPSSGSPPTPSNSAGDPPAASGNAATAGSQAGPVVPAPTYPPIDHDHIIKAEFNKKGKPTGGHSLLNGDVRIIPGTESLPNAHGVYEAGVEMKKADGTWVQKKSNQSINSMFPKHWTAEKIREEVQAAWDNPNRVVDNVDNSWSSVSPSGVKIEGFIDTTNNRVTAFPLY